MIQNINKLACGGNVALKIDMAKAYNGINQAFLFHSLAGFGFSEEFCILVHHCIFLLWFSVVMIGIPKGFFQGGRGLRQGDPLSLYLLIMVEENLFRLLKKNFQERNISHFQHPRGAPIRSHLLYVDNILIFASRDKKLIQAIYKVLVVYKSWSGQRVNKEKSSIIFSNLIPCSRWTNILHISDFFKGFLPFKYLGVPIVFRRLKAVHFGEFLGKIRENFGGWQSQLLSSKAHLCF